MKKLLPFLLLACPLQIIFAAAQSDFEQQENDKDIAAFMQTLQGEIQKQAQFVQTLQNQINRKDVIQDSSIVFRYGNAVEMLTVKKTLYANFVNTPSIQSPLVRQKLLSIFQKELITAGDLAELQALVNQERPKYLPVPAPTPTVPTTPAAPTTPPQ
jgi:hypothetical protein